MLPKDFCVWSQACWFTAVVLKSWGMGITTSLLSVWAKNEFWVILGYRVRPCCNKTDKQTKRKEKAKKARRTKKQTHSHLDVSKTARWGRGQRGKSIEKSKRPGVRASHRASCCSVERWPGRIPFLGRLQLYLTNQLSVGTASTGTWNPKCLPIKHGLLLLSQVSDTPCVSPSGPINLVRGQFRSLLELHCHLISSTTLAPYGKIHDPKVIKPVCLIQTARAACLKIAEKDDPQPSSSLLF